MLSSTLCLLLILLLTPDKANWCRMIFLGATDASYHCLLIHRTHPSSHYAVYDSVYIARFSNADNRLEDRKLIRAWAWTTPDDKSLVTDSAFAFDIAAYMTDLKLRNQFPSDDLEKYTFTFTGSRLYLQSGTDTSLLVDSTLICRSQEWLLPSIYRTPLEHLTRHLEGMLSQARVVEYFQTGSFYYFLIRTGWGSGDTNFLQFIIPVPELTVRDGIRKLKGEK